MTSFDVTLFIWLTQVVWVNNLSEVKFGDPNLHEVRLARKYELDGVAFIMEKPIGFTFYLQCTGSLSIVMEALEQSKRLYNFFKELFKEPLAPMKKDSLLSTLNVELSLKTENNEVLLQRIENSMGSEWRKAFDTIISAHET